MSRPRRLRWDLPESPPKHPYRDTLLVYGGLSLVIVLLAWLTGGGIGRAIGIAAVFFVVASAWSWWRWRQRLERAARAKEQDTL
jgi:membrane protein implicated in regulation of membrane protease activity